METKSLIKIRCDWVTSADIITRYHDEEWGVSVHEDHRLYEFLILDGMQAGLSWSTILRKRIALRDAFIDFNPNKIANFTSKDVRRLMRNESIIRNKQKIMSAINNAKRFLEVKEEFKTFDSYIWSFVGNKTMKNRYKKWSNIPAFSNESKLMSRDLKKRGFTFVGPRICYAFMQSIGMVNDHIVTCFRRKEVMK